MTEYRVVATKSTVPVGTGQKLREVIQQTQTESVRFDVVANPEFLREGSAIEDFMRPNRVIIGTDSDQAVAIMKDLYRPLYLIETPIVVTDVATAELIKYAANAFLATKITFINEIADLCEKVGADVHDVAKGIGLDGRIGRKFLHPGPGYGGSCFPKDTAAMMHTARQADADFPLLQGVIDGNREQHERMVEKARRLVGGSLTGVDLGVWGLTFKANTDDVRDSPAVYIVRRLLEEGAVIRAYDPAARADAVDLPGLTRVDTALEAAKGASLLVVLTEWDEFRWLDFDAIGDALAARVVLDTRNLLDAVALRRRGWIYEGVGR